MKKEYITVFLIIIAIVLGIIFYFTNNKLEKPNNSLQYTVGCSSAKIDASVYSLRGDTSLIGAFITFNEIPITDATKAELTKLGVVLLEDTWTFDYALAEIPTDSLCTLADYDFVKYVFIPIEK